MRTMGEPWRARVVDLVTLLPRHATLHTSTPVTTLNDDSTLPCQATLVNSRVAALHAHRGSCQLGGHWAPGGVESWTRVQTSRHVQPGTWFLGLVGPGGSRCMHRSTVLESR